MIERLEALIAEATGKPWFFDNGIAPGADVFEAEDIEEFAQIMRHLAPLIAAELAAWRAVDDLFVTGPTTDDLWEQRRSALIAQSETDAYCASHLHEGDENQ
jgi:hypothetical protein